MDSRWFLLFAATLSLPSMTMEANNFCQSKRSGLHGNPADCTTYYMCFNSVTYTFNCPSGLHYNSVGSYCDWPGNAVCARGTTKAPTTKASRTVRTTKTGPVQLGNHSANASTTAIKVTNTMAPTTAIKVTNTVASTTAIKVTNTVAPTTAIKVTNTVASTTAIQVTNTAAPTTAIQVTNTVAPTTAIQVTNTVASTTAIKVTNTVAPTTAIQVTNTMAPTAIKVTNTVALTTERPEASEHCDYTNCQSPNCYCLTSDIPMGLSREQTPQFIMPTFDDGVTVFNIQYYRQIFNGERKNPGNCTISGTFFVSNNNTDYSLVDELYSMNLEVASHSSTHRTPEDWWSGASKAQWLEEIESQDDNTISQSGAQVKGWRSPFLRLGGNNQFEALEEAGYLYDSTMSIHPRAKPFWPFTLKTKFTEVCVVPPCPTYSFPDIFEVPLSNYVDKAGFACSMFDSCYSAPQNANDTFDLFKSNFEKHYNTSRAPFPMFGHASFFSKYSYAFEGYLRFLDYALSLDDVYVVSIEQMLDWMQSPLPLQDMRNITSALSCNLDF